jgi:hypothetical protein
MDEPAFAGVADLPMSGMKFGVNDNLFHNDGC